MSREERRFPTISPTLKVGALKVAVEFPQRGNDPRRIVSGGPFSIERCPEGVYQGKGLQALPAAEATKGAEHVADRPTDARAEGGPEKSAHGPTAEGAESEAEQSSDR